MDYVKTLHDKIDTVSSFYTSGWRRIYCDVGKITYHSRNIIAWFFIFGKFQTFFINSNKFNYIYTYTDWN